MSQICCCLHVPEIPYISSALETVQWACCNAWSADLPKKLCPALKNIILRIVTLVASPLAFLLRVALSILALPFQCFLARRNSLTTRTSDASSSALTVRASDALSTSSSALSRTGSSATSQTNNPAFKAYQESNRKVLKYILEKCRSGGEHPAFLAIEHSHTASGTTETMGAMMQITKFSDERWTIQILGTTLQRDLAILPSDQEINSLFSLIPMGTMTGKSQKYMAIYPETDEARASSIYRARVTEQTYAFEHFAHQETDTRSSSSTMTSSGSGTGITMKGLGSILKIGGDGFDFTPLLEQARKGIEEGRKAITAEADKKLAIEA